MKQNHKLNNSAYFLLPLTGVNKNDFQDNLIQCYLVIEKIALGIHVMDIDLVDDELTYGNPNYELSITRDDETNLIIYKMPEQFIAEYNHYVDGKYSKFSEKATNIILLKSGLTVNKKTIIQGKTVMENDIRVVALIKDKYPSIANQYRNVLSDRIQSTVSEDAELFEAPNLDLEIL